VAARIDTKKAISSGVEVGDSKIIVGTLKGEVLAFDMTGKPLWTSMVGGEVISPAAVTKGNAIVRTSDGRVIGLSTLDGKRHWIFQRPAPALLLRTEAGVLAMAGDVVAGFPNGKLVALDGDDGKLIWEATVSLPRGATELERIADIAGLPVVDGGNVCAAAFQGKVACYEIQSRNLIWSRDLSTALNLARDDKSLYLVDENGAVHALDKKSGASLWKQDKLLYRKVTYPVAVGGAVMVGDGFGFLHVLSADTGAFIGRLATDGTPILSMVPATNGVVVQTAGGTVSLVRF
jgi:outer membrane protein assembly factor BamB